MNKDQGHGNGARDNRQARLTQAIHARCARRLEALASQLARARARRQEAFTGREVSQTTEAEMTGIYHEAAVKAYAATGKAIHLGSLFARGKKGGVNPYPFRVRLAWIRAIKQAGKLAVAECYQMARVECEAASMADLRTLEDHFSGHGERQNDQSAKASALAWNGHGATRDRGVMPVNARQVRHARECLIAFWGLSGSKRWAWALRSDLALLAKCVRVARGEGFIAWEDSAMDFHNSKTRFAVSRLLQRIGAGDVLMTEQPDESETALRSWAHVRRISPIVAKV